MSTEPLPITAERIELAMDDLAVLMTRKGIRAEKLLPNYRRLERELADYRLKEDLMSDVWERARRSRDRTAGRASAARPGAR